MILLTRLDGQPIAVNEALIVFAEATPDTVITMASGQRLIVREKVDELLQRAREFHQGVAPSGGSHG